jgi:glutathione S-transferase
MVAHSVDTALRIANHFARYLLKWSALSQSEWLVGGRFTMADVAMAPCVNRLSALALDRLWLGGRLPRVTDWFERVQSRPSFEPAFVKWMPAELGAEMRANGALTWPAIAGLLNAAPKLRADC